MKKGIHCSRGVKEVPEHPCLEWVATSQDDLYRDVSRRLITMRKVKEYRVELREEYKKHTRSMVYPMWIFIKLFVAIREE